MIEVNHNNKLKNKRVEIYNANYEVIHINPFAEKQVEHTGAIVRENEELGEEINNVSLVRLNFQTHPFDFLIRPFYFLGAKRNISKYFSANQYNSSMVDIPISCKFSDLDLKIPMGYAEFCTVNVIGNGAVDEVELYPSKEFYVVIRNDSHKCKKVNIVDLAQGIITSPMIHIINSDFNIENGNNFSTMRVMTRNSTQFSENVTVVDGDNTLKVFNYFSANQFQDWIIDIEHNFVVNKDSIITVDIQPKTTVMYHFF